MLLLRLLFGGIVLLVMRIRRCHFGLLLLHRRLGGSFAQICAGDCLRFGLGRLHVQLMLLLLAVLLLMMRLLVMLRMMLMLLVIGHLRGGPFLGGGGGGRRGGRHAARIFVQHALGERQAEFRMGRFKFVVRLGVHLEAEIEDGLGLLQGAGRLEIARPADVEDGAFGADVALVQQLVQIEGVRFEVDLCGGEYRISKTLE